MNPERFTEIAAKRRPRAEFDVFIERYPTELASYDRIPQGGLIPRSFQWAGSPALGVSALALEHRRKYRALLTTAENVGFPLALQAKLIGSQIPIGVITHGSYFGSRFMQTVATLLRTTRRVRYLTLSEPLRQQMLERFGFPAGSVVNTGYGVDTEFFKPRRAQPTVRPVVASAGAASRDYRTLIAATGDLDVDIRIAADSTWFPGSVDISADRLPANCEARSYGDYQGLRELYASAAFVVVPLHPAFHACGLAVIAEAMAMGKAVITTQIAGRSDFVIDGENGFYVAPADVSALRGRIQELLNDPGRALEMGAAARRRMESLFSLEAYVERLAEAVLSI
jgi:hypothetical protein